MMKKVSSFSLAILCCLSLAAGFQGNDQKSITVTGCLQKGSEPNNYVLRDVMSSQDPAGQTHSSAYVLRDARKHGAKGFLGQRVVVSGVPMIMTPSNQGKTSNPPASGDINQQPGLRVTSMKAAQGTCP